MSIPMWVVSENPSLKPTCTCTRATTRSTSLTPLGNSRLESELGCHRFRVSIFPFPIHSQTRPTQLFAPWSLRTKEKKLSAPSLIKARKSVSTGAVMGDL